MHALQAMHGRISSVFPSLVLSGSRVATRPLAKAITSAFPSCKILSAKRGLLILPGNNHGDSTFCLIFAAASTLHPRGKVMGDDPFRDL